MKVVVLTNTVDNAGDFLHRYASLRLIKSKLKVGNLREIDRNDAIKPENHDVLESADIIFIPGGPSFRQNLIPQICNIPEKFWWKTSLLGSGVKHRKKQPFNDSTLRFLNTSLPISVRDLATELVAKDVISSNQVYMTGCPVSSLTPEMINDDFGVGCPSDISFVDIAISDGQDYNKGANQIVHHLGRLIPNSKIIQHTRRDSNQNDEHSTLSIGGSHERLINVYRNCGVHLGFRVHAHLVCLSLGVPSILIVEDERGASLAKQYGCETLDFRNRLFILKVLNRIGFNSVAELVAKKYALQIIRKSKRVPVTIQTHTMVSLKWDSYFSSVLEALKKRQNIS